MQLIENFVRDQVTGIGLSEAPFQSLFQRGPLLRAHAFGRRVVQVDAHFTAIRQIDRFVDDNLAVNDVSLQRSHSIKIHEGTAAPHRSANSRRTSGILRGLRNGCVSNLTTSFGASTIALSRDPLVDEHS